ncbi:MAG: signal peptidase I [Verrucomicrobiales bacterium]|nr:signal peptidase I [Verrucomicrobiales bacterium]
MNDKAPTPPAAGRAVQAGVCALLFVFVASSPGCRRQFQQPSSAMLPTIAPGERVTVDLGAYSRRAPARWDVVALEAPPSNYLVLKRVIALPGETISLTATGIIVDDSLMKMPSTMSNVVYRAPDSLPPAQRGDIIPFPYTVPSNSYFVVGDNWANSWDSRHYGAVSKANFRGRVENK